MVGVEALRLGEVLERLQKRGEWGGERRGREGAAARGGVRRRCGDAGGCRACSIWPVPYSALPRTQRRSGWSECFRIQRLDSAITWVFLFYTWRYATIIEHLHQYGKEPSEYDCF